MRRLGFAALGMGMLLAGCATVETPPAVSPWPTGTVDASAETVPVGTANQDAADDPAIWRNAADPANSLIVGTDKKAGLYVYGLDGAVRSFLPAGQLNNVDLIELGDGTVLVGASDRGDPANAQIAFFTLSPAGLLTALPKTGVGPGEAYGFCMAPPTGDGLMRSYMVTKQGPVMETVFGGTPKAMQKLSSRVFTIATQAEGCVVDPRTDTLYVGEENAGIWRFDLAATAPVGELVARADGLALVADVEGLTLAPIGETGGYLIASSQGDNAYTAFALPSMDYIGRVRIADSGDIDGTSETDGIAFAPGDFGSVFPEGLFVAQDGDNQPGTGTQNFKLVRGDRLLAAFRNGR